MSFDSIVDNILGEMAATYKDIGAVKSTISDIKTKNLPHHYQKPLIAIVDDKDRDEMIDKIINKVFGSENFNPVINTKKELQDALEKAVIEVSSGPESKFLRPVSGVSASYLGRWLGTNINVAYSTETAKKQIEDKGVTKQAAEHILQKTLTPTESEKEELAKEEQDAETKSDNGSSKENSLNKEYSFDERTFEMFRETIEKANKRNARYGIPSVQIEELGEEFVDVKERQAGERFFNDILHRALPAKKVRKVKFKLTVPELKMDGGWEFIGRVDHEEIGNLIVSVPGTEHGIDLHKMFGNSEPSYCDHCNTTRRRTSTFVLKNAEGKIKRVGRQCLKDYLPGGDKAVSQVVSYAQYLSDIEERLRNWESKSYGEGDYADDGLGGGSRSMSHFNARGIIGVTIAIVKAMGYMSKSQANKYSESGDVAPLTTADVIDMMYNDLDATKKEPKLKEVFADLKENNEKYTKEAEKIVDWADEYLDKQLEDQYNKMREYYQNLSTIVKGIKKSVDAHIPKKYLGYLVSIVPLYNKHLESENAEKKASQSGEKVSQYVGMIGMPIGELNPTDKRKLKKHNENFPSSKVEIDQFPYDGPIEITVDNARTFQRQSYSYYDSGLSYMYSMTDDKGNVYVYFASQEIDLKAGDKAKIVKATVKNHKDYTTKSGKTIKQTYLTRVKFDEA